MQRLNLREIELEAELAGIDMELGARGFGSRMHDGGAGDEFFFDSDVVSKDEIGTQGNRTPVALAVATTVEGATETRGKRLQPHLPHVLHDLPLVFGQASKYAYRGPERLPPLMGSSYQLKSVPKSSEVLWPKPIVETPHYPSADPVLLSEFVGTLGESLIE
jgi:hypothetical protein